ncbi:MAG: small multi-drug export protein [Flavobacteriales bacterium]|nr:small multi-drug export protein [Flavobacteriales bacterium]MCB9335745.1 small multi-drug export protein [Flavobacteriales bacterium]
MIELFYTFLLSISPLGEARVGIPYGALSGIPVGYAFLIGWIANLFVFPLFYKSIDWSNKSLWKRRWYKKGAVYLSKRAKNKTQNTISKYGQWGLMVFVMIPLPVTGAYIGTLAAYILRMDYKKSFIAVNTGVTISCIILATGMFLGIKSF